MSACSQPFTQPDGRWSSNDEGYAIGGCGMRVSVALIALGMAAAMSSLVGGAATGRPRPAALTHCSRCSANAGGAFVPRAV